MQTSLFGSTSTKDFFFFNLLYSSSLFKLKNEISIVNFDFRSKVKYQLLITISINNCKRLQLKFRKIIFFMTELLRGGKIGK